MSRPIGHIESNDFLRYLRPLKGNPGKRPVCKPPQPARTEQCPEPPKHLTGHAREAWLQLAPELHKLNLGQNRVRHGSCSDPWSAAKLGASAFARCSASGMTGGAGPRVGEKASICTLRTSRRCICSAWRIPTREFASLRTRARQRGRWLSISSLQRKANRLSQLNSWNLCPLAFEAGLSACAGFCRDAERVRAAFREASAMLAKVKGFEVLAQPRSPVRVSR